MTYELFCCFVNNVPQPPHGEVAFEPTSPFSHEIPIAVVIEEILLLADYSLEGEWEGQVRYLPLR
jgi:hypothetical protein